MWKVELINANELLQGIWKNYDFSQNQEMQNGKFSKSIWSRVKLGKGAIGFET